MEPTCDTHAMFLFLSNCDTGNPAYSPYSAAVETEGDRLRRKTAAKRDQRQLRTDDEQLFHMADEDGR